MDLVGKNLAVNLPDGDAGHAFTSFPDAEQRMLERGQLGRKARDKGGFGRVLKSDDGSKSKETFDLVKELWRAPSAPDLDGVPTELGDVVFHDSPQGRLAWDLFADTLLYAASLVPEIADDIANVDNAIRWGFNWKKGPFEMLDHLGPARVRERLEAEGRVAPSMLAVLAREGGETFYRETADGRAMLMPDGSVQPVPATH